MEDEELLRYSRHILLNEIGIEGQRLLSNAHVLIIGAGGLGSACAPYLASSGVGKITIVDNDLVELTNLQRQIMHDMSSIGQSKVSSAKKMLNQLNPLIEIVPLQFRADETFLEKLVPHVNIVIDCTDNFKTRHLINRSCVKHKIPLVSGAAIQLDGQVCIFDHSNPICPCYACIFPEEDTFEEIKCSTMGVFAPLVGIIGSLQAAQALQMILKFGNPLIGKLLIWDALKTEITQIQLQKNIQCKVCSSD
jgi:molybdopterin/thiamine biosynthesis adenylyltransferase